MVVHWVPIITSRKMQKKLLVMSGCSVVITGLSNIAVNDFCLRPPELRELNEVQCIMGNGNMAPPDVFKPMNLRPHCAAPPPGKMSLNLDLTVQGPFLAPDSHPQTPTDPPWLASGPFVSCWNAFL